MPTSVSKSQPDVSCIRLKDNVRQIEQMLMELVLLPRRDLIKWAEITKQTPNMKIGYPGQHLASLVTGMEGQRTGARGHDLCDGSEVKSCSRIDQLDKCRTCNAAVARIEITCPECDSTNIKRNNDSKWLFGIRSEDELAFLLDDVPRVVLIISDYVDFNGGDWDTIQFQAFEIWPQAERHKHFRTLMDNYYHNIYLRHIEQRPNKTPAPKNFWPYSFQFYMCNPVRVFHCVVNNATTSPHIDLREYVEPAVDRATIEPLPMPLGVLNSTEKSLIRDKLGAPRYRQAQTTGVTADERLELDLRDTDHATPQSSSYRRGVRR